MERMVLLVTWIFIFTTASARFIKDDPNESLNSQESVKDVKNESSDIQGTCFYNGTWFPDKAELPTRGLCLICHCFQGFSEPNAFTCSVIDCPWEDYHKRFPGCTPIYADRDCCPIGWECDYGTTNPGQQQSKSPDCDCEWRYLKHYEAKGCRPVYEEKPWGDKPSCQCPWRFDCSLADEIQPDDKACVYKKHVYPIGSKIPTSNPCETCTCSRDYFTQAASISCNTIECPSVYSQTPLPEGCHYVYMEKQCCPTSVECPTAQKDNIYQVPICEYKDKMYYEGEQIYPDEDPCMICLCSQNWTGINSTSCRQHDCMLERDSRKLKQGCIPIYHEKTCCPIDYHCADDDLGFEANRGASFKSDDDEDEMCFFENRYYQIGHVLDIKHPTNCVTCTCKTPPDFTCIHSSCPPPPNSDYTNCRAVYKPQSCCPDYTCAEKTGAQSCPDPICKGTNCWLVRTDDGCPTCRCKSRCLPCPAMSQPENPDNECSGCICQINSTSFLDFESKKGEEVKESEVDSSLQALIEQCKKMECPTGERCMLVDKKCENETCLPEPKCEKVAFGCGQATCPEGCEKIGTYENDCPICCCKKPNQEEQYKLSCRVQSCEENCILIGRDENNCPLCKCPQGNLEERTCAVSPCLGYNCTLEVNAFGCAECSCQLTCKPKECPAGCDVDLDAPVEGGFECGCKCLNSSTAMDHIHSKPLPETCPQVSCQGQNCSIGEDKSGCPTCSCTAPCPTPECQQGCALEKEVSEPGRCPGCVCKLSRAARDNTAKECPALTCLGYNCSVVAGEDGCQKCQCESPCEESPSCPPQCSLEPVAPEGRCKGCICSGADNDDSDEKSQQPQRGGGKVPEDGDLPERREDSEADFIPLPGSDLVPGVDKIYLIHGDDDQEHAGVPGYHYNGGHAYPVFGEPLESVLYSSDLEDKLADAEEGTTEKGRLEDLDEEASEDRNMVVDYDDYPEHAEEKAMDDEDEKCAKKDCPEGQKCVIRRLQCIRNPCPTIPVCIDVEPRCPIPMCAIGCMVMKWDDEVCPSCFCGIIRGAEGRVCPRTACMGRRCYNVIGDDGCPACKCDSICIPPTCSDGCWINSDPPEGKCPTCVCSQRSTVLPQIFSETASAVNDTGYVESSGESQAQSSSVDASEESRANVESDDNGGYDGQKPQLTSQELTQIEDKSGASSVGHDDMDHAADFYDALAEIELEATTQDLTTVTVNLPTTEIVTVGITNTEGFFPFPEAEESDVAVSFDNHGPYSATSTLDDHVPTSLPQTTSARPLPPSKSVVRTQSTLDLDVSTTEVPTTPKKNCTMKPLTAAELEEEGKFKTESTTVKAQVSTTTSKPSQSQVTLSQSSIKPQRRPAPVRQTSQPNRHTSQQRVKPQTSTVKPQRQTSTVKPQRQTSTVKPQRQTSKRPSRPSTPQQIRKPAQKPPSAKPVPQAVIPNDTIADNNMKPILQNLQQLMSNLQSVLSNHHVSTSTAPPTKPQQESESVDEAKKEAIKEKRPTTKPNVGDELRASETKPVAQHQKATAAPPSTTISSIELDVDQSNQQTQEPDNEQNILPQTTASAQHIPSDYHQYTVHSSVPPPQLENHPTSQAQLSLQQQQQIYSHGQLIGLGNNQYQPNMQIPYGQQFVLPQHHVQIPGAYYQQQPGSFNFHAPPNVQQQAVPQSILPHQAVNFNNHNQEHTESSQQADQTQKEQQSADSVQQQQSASQVNVQNQIPIQQQSNLHQVQYSNQQHIPNYLGVHHQVLNQQYIQSPMSNQGGYVIGPIGPQFQHQPGSQQQILQPVYQAHPSLQQPHYVSSLSGNYTYYPYHQQQVAVPQAQVQQQYIPSGASGPLSPTFNQPPANPTITNNHRPVQQQYIPNQHQAPYQQNIAQTYQQQNVFSSAPLHPQGLVDVPYGQNQYQQQYITSQSDPIPPYPQANQSIPGTQQQQNIVYQQYQPQVPVPQQLAPQQSQNVLQQQSQQVPQEPIASQAQIVSQQQAHVPDNQLQQESFYQQQLPQSQQQYINGSEIPSQSSVSYVQQPQIQQIQSQAETPQQQLFSGEPAQQAQIQQQSAVEGILQPQEQLKEPSVHITAHFRPHDAYSQSQTELLKPDIQDIQAQVFQAHIPQSTSSPPFIQTQHTQINLQQVGVSQTVQEQDKVSPQPQYPISQDKPYEQQYIDSKQQAEYQQQFVNSPDPQPFGQQSQQQYGSSQSKPLNQQYEIQNQQQYIGVQDKPLYQQQYIQEKPLPQQQYLQEKPLTEQQYSQDRPLSQQQQLHQQYISNTSDQVQLQQQYIGTQNNLGNQYNIQQQYHNTQIKPAQDPIQTQQTYIPSQQYINHANKSSEQQSAPSQEKPYLQQQYVPTQERPYLQQQYVSQQEKPYLQQQYEKPSQTQQQYVSSDSKPFTQFQEYQQQFLEQQKQALQEQYTNLGEKPTFQQVQQQYVNAQEKPLQQQYLQQQYLSSQVKPESQQPQQHFIHGEDKPLVQQQHPQQQYLDKQDKPLPQQQLHQQYIDLGERPVAQQQQVQQQYLNPHDKPLSHQQEVQQQYLNPHDKPLSHQQEVQQQYVSSQDKPLPQQQQPQQQYLDSQDKPLSQQQQIQQQYMSSQNKPLSHQEQIQQNYAYQQYINPQNKPLSQQQHQQQYLDPQDKPLSQQHQIQQQYMSSQDKPLSQQQQIQQQYEHQQYINPQDKPLSQQEQLQQQYISSPVKPVVEQQKIVQNESTQQQHTVSTDEQPEYVHQQYVGAYEKPAPQKPQIHQEYIDTETSASTKPPLQQQYIHQQYISSDVPTTPQQQQQYIHQEFISSDVPSSVHPDQQQYIHQEYISGDTTPTQNLQQQYIHQQYISDDTTPAQNLQQQYIHQQYISSDETPSPSLQQQHIHQEYISSDIATSTSDQQKIQQHYLEADGDSKKQEQGYSQQHTQAYITDEDYADTEAHFFEIVHQGQESQDDDKQVPDQQGFVDVDSDSIKSSTVDPDQVLQQHVSSPFEKVSQSPGIKTRPGAIVNPHFQQLSTGRPSTSSEDPFPHDLFPVPSRPVNRKPPVQNQDWHEDDQDDYQSPVELAAEDEEEEEEEEEDYAEPTETTVTTVLTTLKPFTPSKRKPTRRPPVFFSTPRISTTTRKAINKIQQQFEESFDNHQPDSQKVPFEPQENVEELDDTTTKKFATKSPISTKAPSFFASLSTASPTAEEYGMKKFATRPPVASYHCPTPHCNGYNCSLIRGSDGCQKCVCDSPCAPCPQHCVKTKTLSEGRCPICDCTVSPQLSHTEERQCPVVDCIRPNCRTVQDSDGCASCVCDPKCAIPKCDPGCEILTNVPPGQCPGCVCKVTVIQAASKKKRPTCPSVSCTGPNCKEVLGEDGCRKCLCQPLCPAPKCDPGCEIQTDVAQGQCPTCVCSGYMDDEDGDDEMYCPNLFCADYGCREIPGPTGCPICLCDPICKTPTCDPGCQVVTNRYHGRCPVCICSSPSEPPVSANLSSPIKGIQQQMMFTDAQEPFTQQEISPFSFLQTTVTVELETTTIPTTTTEEPTTTTCPPPVCQGLRCNVEMGSEGCEVCKCKYKCPQPKCVGHCYAETNAPPHRCPGCVCPQRRRPVPP